MNFFTVCFWLIICILLLICPLIIHLWPTIYSLVFIRPLIICWQSFHCLLMTFHQYSRVFLSLSSLSMNIYLFSSIHSFKIMSHFDAVVYTARRFEMCEIVESTLFYLRDHPQVHSDVSGLPFMVRYTEILIILSNSVFDCRMVRLGSSWENNWSNWQYLNITISMVCMSNGLH